MMSLHPSVVVVLLLLVVAGASGGSSIQDDCNTYLAESTVKNAGWGVFAGKSFQLGERVGPPGLGIQLIDPAMEQLGAFSEILWDSARVGGFSEANFVATFLPGIASLAIHRPHLANIAPGGLSYDPGTDGGFTTYHNFTFIAIRNIRAGEELFVDREDTWFRKSKLASAEDYARADEIVAGLSKYRDKYSSSLTEVQWIDILYRIRQEMLLPDDLVAGILPQTLHELRRAQEHGVASVKMVARDLTWVHSHGRCLDNIEEGNSKIPGAGHGAFATRPIQRGAVISPAPLVPMFDKESLTIMADPSKSLHQLLINYCFGHRFSSLLLCPKSHVALINHHNNPRKANAEIRWASSTMSFDRSQHADIDYLLLSLDELENNNNNTSLRMSFDVVALRDIEPGEEIYLNYGEQWTRAWSDHQNNANNNSTHGSASPGLLSESNKRHLPMSDLESTIAFECLLQQEHVRHKFDDVMEEDYSANSDLLVGNAEVCTLHDGKDHLAWHPCDVFGYDATTLTYNTAEVFSKPLGERKLLRRYWNIPTSAVRNVSRPYESAQHHRNSFRHFIPISDSMFPLRWRSDYVEARSMHLGELKDVVDVRRGSSQLMETYEQSLRTAKCGLYYAESTIPKAGFGIFSAVPIPWKGVVVGSTFPVVFVPDIFPPFTKWSGFDYIWEAITYGAEYETGPDVNGKVIAINLGALSNSHAGLINLGHQDPVLHPVLDRRTDPGAGAFSDYVNYSFMSAHSIEAGDELFISYGEEWFMSRAQFQDVPLRQNFRAANLIVSSLWALTRQEGASLGREEQEALLMLAKHSLVKSNRTRSALFPFQSAADLHRVVARNGTAQVGSESRSLEWLEANGQCIDHLYVKRSTTIEQAGSGAFARRFLREGSVAISSPLLATFGLEAMTMDSPFIPRDVVVNPLKLMYNYHFGHANSSVLFLPVTQMMSINHQSSRRREGGIASPNAKLLWAKWNRKSLYFLHRPLEDLKKEKYPAMILEVVVTRDIEPDEEVFIDYGQAWEDAWNSHVQNWKPPYCEVPNLCFKSSKAVVSMNLDKFNPVYHPWSDDHFTVCRIEHVMTSNETIHLDNSPFDSDSGSPNHKTSFHGITSKDFGFMLAQINSDLNRPCRILNFRVGLDFDVVVYFSNNDDEHDGSNSVLRRHRFLPAAAIEFIHKPYTSDMYWPGAFRHVLEIPDEIFPPLWKDLI